MKKVFFAVVLLIVLASGCIQQTQGNQGQTACGNGLCDGTETIESCPADCSGTETPPFPTMPEGGEAPPELPF